MSETDNIGPQDSEKPSELGRSGGSYFRALLVLGRISNLPTVWANCLTGWLLSGGSHFGVSFWYLQLAATFFYIGGMYWNDAFDVEWDSKYAKERPIPSGAIPAQHVWILGGLWFCLGFGFCIPLGEMAMLFSIPLFAVIMWYDGVHKKVSWSPIIMAGCRFFLILFAAASNGVGYSELDGVTMPGYVIWTALFLFTYVVGLSYIARHERLDSPFDLWPVGLLCAPIIWALVFNAPDEKWKVFFFIIPFVMWTGIAIFFVLRRKKRNPGRAVSFLLAGIVLVDLMTIQPMGGEILLIYSILFLLCPVMQKWIPAT